MESSLICNGSVVLRRYSDVVLDPLCLGFDFATPDHIVAPERFEDDKELLDFITIYGLSPSEFFN